MYYVQSLTINLRYFVCNIYITEPSAFNREKKNILAIFFSINFFLLFFFCNKLLKVPSDNYQ